MIEVVKMRTEHLLSLKEVGALKYLGDQETDFSFLENNSFSRTAISPEGRILFVGGLVEWWKGRAEGWAFFHPECKKYFVEIHNGVKRFLDNCPYDRVEAVVDIGFEPGHRWARALDFEVEAPVMLKYGPRGQNSVLYARVR